ncbi:hypothetical protein HK104_005794, partial [Borealophlyctis nickersoniae]
ETPEITSLPLPSPSPSYITTVSPLSTTTNDITITRLLPRSPSLLLPHLKQAHLPPPPPRLRTLNLTLNLTHHHHNDSLLVHVSTLILTSMHDPPFWEQALVPEYSRWWIPRNGTRGEAALHDIPTQSWFHHVQYGYASGGPRLLTRIASTSDATVSPDAPTDGTGANGRAKNKRGGRKRKQKPAESPIEQNAQPPPKKGVLFKSTKQTPPGHVLRTYRLRFYPTPQQQAVLRTWFAGVRHTYNWALSVLKNHYNRGLRLINPANRVALKTAFVTCHISRVPRRLRWMKSIPYSVREEATKELSLAYAAAFRKLEDGSTNTFDNIKFRSAKNPHAASVTIPTANFSRRAGHRWDFYTTTLPNGGHVRFHQRDIRRIISTHPDGPPRAVKLTMTKTGRFFMHVPLYVQKRQVSPEAQGHLVTLDPGSNPYMTYYSPTVMLTGSFGTTLDLQTTFRPLQKRLDSLHSLLVKALADDDDAPYLPPNIRHRLRLRRLRIHEKVRDRTTECINKIVLHLTNGYQYIHGSIFEVENMVKRPTYTVVEGGKTRIRQRKAASNYQTRLADVEAQRV